jgi:hypothetical protein
MSALAWEMLEKLQINDMDYFKNIQKILIEKNNEKNNEKA